MNVQSLLHAQLGNQIWPRSDVQKLIGSGKGEFTAVKYFPVGDLCIIKGSMIASVHMARTFLSKGLTIKLRSKDEWGACKVLWLVILSTDLKHAYEYSKTTQSVGLHPYTHASFVTSLDPRDPCRLADNHRSKLPNVFEQLAHNMLAARVLSHHEIVNHVKLNHCWNGMNVFVSVEKAWCQTYATHNSQETCTLPAWLKTHQPSDLAETPGVLASTAAAAAVAETLLLLLLPLPPLPKLLPLVYAYTTPGDSNIAPSP